MSKRIGEAMYLSTHFGMDAWDVPRMRDNKLGGGALMDLGIYGVQLALWVFQQEPTRISASAIMKNGTLHRVREIRRKCPANFENVRRRAIKCPAWLKTISRTLVTRL